MLAYCTALGLPEGHLVYATAHAPRRSYRIVHSGVRVTVHGLDLAAPRADVRRQIESLADAVVAGG